MKLENIDFKKRVNIGKYALWVCLTVFLLIALFFLMAYMGIQLGPENPLDPVFSKFFIVNEFTKYVNPLYIILIQFILDWGGFVCVLSAAMGLLLVYIISKSWTVISFSVCFTCIALMNLFHFLSVQHIIFTKIPYPWSLFTWWENRLFIATSLMFPPIINWIYSRYKTYTNNSLVFFSIVFYFLLSFGFIYFGLAIETQPEAFFKDYLPHQRQLFIPICVAILFTLPALIFGYKTNPSFFSGLMVISIIPFCLGELFTLLKPQEHYYISINIAHVLELLMLILPLIGVFIDSRMIFYELEFVRDKAHQNIETKNTFLASFSKQLKTPLNSIIGQSECLAKEYDGPINEKQRQSLQSVLKSTENLSHLISDIIDVTKIESGDIIYSPEDIDLVEQIITCVKAFTLKAREQQLEVIYEGPNERKSLISDYRRIRQVLIQLIDNAYKYTDQGKITVSLEEDESNYYVKVSDTGIGIKSSAFEKIFEPYIQLNTSNKKDITGIGLGLPIAKKIIESMGGNISLTSEEGKGTTFTVTFVKKQHKEEDNKIIQSGKETVKEGS